MCPSRKTFCSAPRDMDRTEDPGCPCSTRGFGECRVGWGDARPDSRAVDIWEHRVSWVFGFYFSCIQVYTCWQGRKKQLNVRVKCAISLSVLNPQEWCSLLFISLVSQFELEDYSNRTIEYVNVASWKGAAVIRLRWRPLCCLWPGSSQTAAAFHAVLVYRLINRHRIKMLILIICTLWGQTYADKIQKCAFVSGLFLWFELHHFSSILW